MRSTLTFSKLHVDLQDLERQVTDDLSTVTYWREHAEKAEVALAVRETELAQVREQLSSASPRGEGMLRKALESQRDQLFEQVGRLEEKADIVRAEYQELTRERDELRATLNAVQKLVQTREETRKEVLLDMMAASATATGKAL